MESIGEKLQKIIDDGQLPGWTLVSRDDEWNRAFLRHTDCAAGDEGTGISFYPEQGSSKQRITAYATFPEFQGFESGRDLLITNRVTLGLAREDKAFTRDLNRRLLAPFLAALPAAIEIWQGWIADEAEKEQIFQGLRGRVAGDVWVREGENHRFDVNLPNLFSDKGVDTRIKAKVNHASRGKLFPYPASVDLTLTSVPPRLAAAILDLLSEEATN